MQTAGVILDIYDDLTGRVLKQKLAGRPLPKALLEAEVLPAEKLAQLPDRVFGLVARNGDEYLRKYAMHDPENVTLSTIYFLECGRVLPEEAQKVASLNLLQAHRDHGMDVPLALAEKAASYLKEAMYERSDLEATNIDDMRWLDDSVTSKRTKVKTSMEDIPWQGPVDITEHRAPSVVKVAKALHYALPHESRYPIDTPEQVKTASAYFDEHWNEFPYDDRRVYSVMLTKRAEDLGVPVPERAYLYAAKGYGTKVAAQLAVRASNFAGTEFEPIYRDLQTKVASYSPQNMVLALEAVDHASGLDNRYNGYQGILDPYATVYGMDKEAAESKKSWSWTCSGTYVNADMLKDTALNDRFSLERLLGPDATKDFVKDPVTFFEALPDPMKEVVARLSSSNMSGNHRS